MAFASIRASRGYTVGLASFLVVLGCSTDKAGPVQACFQGTAAGGLVCKTGQAMTELTTTEPSTTPTQGEKDVDGDGKADAFLCKSPDLNDDGKADIEENDGSSDGEPATSSGHEDTNGDGVEDDQGCEGMQARGKVDGDNDHDGIGDSADPDDDNDGVADPQDDDRDGDGILDIEDTDTDGDGVPNVLDSK